MTDRYQEFPKRLYRDGQGRTVADPVEEQAAIAQGYRPFGADAQPPATAPVVPALPDPSGPLPPAAKPRRRPARDAAADDVDALTL